MKQNCSVSCLVLHEDHKTGIEGFSLGMHVLECIHGSLPKHVARVDAEGTP